MSMERPLCPLCGSKHFAREPHVWKDGVGRKDLVEKKAEAQAVRLVPSGVSESLVNGAIGGTSGRIEEKTYAPVASAQRIECPVCAANKEANRKRVKAYRERKKLQDV